MDYAVPASFRTRTAILERRRLFHALRKDASLRVIAALEWDLFVFVICALPECLVRRAFLRETPLDCDRDATCYRRDGVDVNRPEAHSTCAR